VKTGTLDTVKSTPSRREAAESGGIAARPVQWWERARTFLVEVRNEMKRVTWPTRREVYATTVVVILVSIFFGVYLWLVDLVLSSAYHWLLARLGAGPA
jgi:preprotein translocase subunit SecE